MVTTATIVTTAGGAEGVVQSVQTVTVKSDECDASAAGKKQTPMTYQL